MKNKTLFYTTLLVTILTVSTNILFAQASIKPAPEFTLMNTNGEKISLSSFKGKTIYLDFWATWCKPCLEEIPGAIKLNKALSDNASIVFITISLDGDTAKWKKMVEKKKMPGIQLNSMQGKDSNIIKNYNVATIPRFIIINKEGMIIDDNAKSPSEEGLIEYLIQLTQ